MWRAGAGAPRHQPFEATPEARGVEQRVEPSRGNAVGASAGWLVMAPVSSGREDQAGTLRPAHPAGRAIHVRPLMELVGGGRLEQLASRRKLDGVQGQVGSGCQDAVSLAVVLGEGNVHFVFGMAAATIIELSF